MGSKSKKVTVGYRYKMGLHFVLCKGPVDRVDEIRAGERQAWIGPVTDNETIYIDNAELFGGDKREGGVLGYGDFMFGGSAQTQNSYLVSKLGTLLPAFRGVVSFVFNGGRVTSNNPYIKPWEFRVQRTDLQPDGTEQWYVAKAKILIPGDGSSGLIGTYYGDINAAVNAGSTATIMKGVPGLDIDGLQATDTVEVSVNLDGTYIAMSVWGVPALGGSNTGSSYNLAVVENDETTYTAYNAAGGPFNGYAAARQAWIDQFGTVTLTGATRYRFGVIDTPINDNSGGLSIVARVYRGLTFYAMNPAHIIRECLTQDYFRMVYPTSMIDDTSFTSAADTFYNEGMGLCMFWSQQTPIKDFLQTVLDHCGATYYADPFTGKFVLKPLRGDYDVATLASFDESSIISVDSYERAGLGETVNQITVVYTDVFTGKDAAVTVQDLANITAQGGAIVGQTRNYPGIPHSALAARVAQRDLLASSTNLAKLKVRFTRKAWSVTPGDVIKISWAKLGIVDLVCRVIGIDYGFLDSGEIIMDLAEDVFGLPTESYEAEQPGGWEEPDDTPLPIEVQDVIEAPYWDVLKQLGSADAALVDPDAAYAATLAARSNGLQLSYDIYSRISPADYEFRDSGGFTAASFLAADVARSDTTISFDSTGILTIPGDDDIAFVTALLHFDGTDGATSITDFRDHVFTAAGNAQIDTAQSKFGGASLLLDGTGDYVSTPSSADFQVGSGDFTIECWIRRAVTGAQHTIANKRSSSSAQEFGFAVGSTDFLSVSLYSGGSPIGTVTGATALAANTWYHVAAERHGSTLRVYVNGVVDGSGAVSGAAQTNTSAFLIGRDGFSTSRDFNGWIDDFRFTKGLARYQGTNFTPPTAPYYEQVSSTVTVGGSDFDTDVLTVGRRLMVGSGRTAEFMAINDITNVGTGIIGVDRGILDTTPQEHAEGTIVWVVGDTTDDEFGEDGIEYTTGDTVDVKLTSSTGSGNSLLANATEMSVTMDQRFARPYPPGKVLIDGEAFPTGDIYPGFAITWAHRDRLQQTVTWVTQDEASIGPETNTLYNLYIYDDATDVLKDSSLGISGTTYTPIEMTGAFTARLELESVNSSYSPDLACWQRQIRTFSYVGTLPLSGFIITRSTTQAITYNTDASVSFDTEVRDDLGYWDVSDPTKAYPPEAGWYVGSHFVRYPATSNWYKGSFVSFASSDGGIRARSDGNDAATYDQSHAVCGIGYWSAVVPSTDNFQAIVGNYGASGTKSISAGARLAGARLYNFNPEIGCYVNKSTGQSIATGTDTALTWNVEAVDVGDMFSSGANTKMTVPTGGAGWYAINAYVRWPSTSTQWKTEIWLRKNGSTVPFRAGRLTCGAGGSGTSGTQVFGLMYLSDADYLEVMVRQNTGSSRTTETSIAPTWTMARNGLVNSCSISVSNSAAQTLVVGDNTVDFDTIDNETGPTSGLADLGASPGELVIPSGEEGWYVIAGYAKCSAVTGTYRRLAIMIDGTENVGEHAIDSIANYNDSALNVGAVVYLTAGQSINLVLETGTVCDIQAGMSRLAVMQLSRAP